MPEPHQLLLFIAAGWLLNLTPGPDVLYIVTHSLRGGARAGLVAGLGITAGCCVHLAAAALGLGTLLATSSAAFTVVKWIGAAYLTWIGVRLLLARSAAVAIDPATPPGIGPARRLRDVFTGGFWTNVLNPKVAIFFLAFIPQFIGPDVDDKALAFVAWGALFNLNSIPVNAGWALGAAWLARRGVVQRGMSWLDRVAGVMFIGFGLRLALTDEPGRQP